MNKNLKFNSKTFVFLALLTMIMPVAFAGWFDFLDGGITGKVATGTHNVTLTTGNSGPTVTAVYSAQSTWDLTPGPTATTPVTIYFEADDPNGNFDLNDTTSEISLNLSTEGVRTASPCTRVANLSATKSNYTCVVNMKYYDVTGNWQINVSISDKYSVPATGYNTTAHAYINSNLNIQIVQPATLSWTSVTSGNRNVTAQAPINISNVGNQNVANLSVTAYDLSGAGYINAANFTASNQSLNVCAGNVLANNSAVNITGANIPRTTYPSEPLNNQSIYYCIPTVPNLAAGSYTQIQSWVTTAIG